MENQYKKLVLINGFVYLVRCYLSQENINELIIFKNTEDLIKVVLLLEL